MGPRDERELKGDDELAADEAAVRWLLGRHGEPVTAEPPPGLAMRVAVAVRAAPGLRPAYRWRRIAGWATAITLALLLALGAWGVLVNSLGPSRIAGGEADGLGQLVFVLTLAAKPLVNLLADAGLAAVLAALASIGGAWLWWRLVRDTPIVPLERTL